MEVMIKDPEEPKEFLPEKKGEVEFKNVYFCYPDADEAVLHNISFTAPAGKTTAFIGSTGSGKSTLINLIPRFFDVSRGSILVDGVDIRDVKQHDLCEKIGYVPQKGVLFSCCSNVYLVVNTLLSYSRLTALPRSLLSYRSGIP